MSLTCHPGSEIWGIFRCRGLHCIGVSKPRKLEPPKRNRFSSSAQCSGVYQPTLAALNISPPISDSSPHGITPSDPVREPQNPQFHTRSLLRNPNLKPKIWCPSPAPTLTGRMPAAHSHARSAGRRNRSRLRLQALDIFRVWGLGFRIS